MREQVVWGSAIADIRLSGHRAEDTNEGPLNRAGALVSGHATYDGLIRRGLSIVKLAFRQAVLLPVESVAWTSIS